MPLGKHKRVSQVCQPLCQIGTLQDGFGFWVSKNTLLLSHKKTQLWKKLGSSSMKKYFHCHRQIIATITPYSAFYLWMTCLKDLKLIDGGLVFFSESHICVKFSLNFQLDLLSKPVWQNSRWMTDSLCAATFFFFFKIFESNHVEVLGIFFLFLKLKSEKMELQRVKSSDGFTVQRLKKCLLFFNYRLSKKKLTVGGIFWAFLTYTISPSSCISFIFKR